MPENAKNHYEKQLTRGKVSKTFYGVNILSGFADENHFLGYIQPHIAGVNKRKQTSILAKAAKTRQLASVLQPLAADDFNAEIKPVQSDYMNRITKQKEFKDTFNTTNYRFSWVNPRKLVSLQVFVTSHKESVPNSLQKLLKFALPEDWNTPAEISFIPPLGPIYVVSSSPHLTGVEIYMDAKKGNVVIRPPKHINLIQVVQLNGRYYLRNGYHRVVDAISEGLTEIPALVLDANLPEEVELFNLGQAGFSAVHSMSLPRPPLVSDFRGKLTSDIEIREKRYGASLSLQISPINIGV